MVLGRKRIAAGAIFVVLVVTLVTAVSTASARTEGANGVAAAAALRTMGFGLPDEIARVRVDVTKAALGGIETEMDTGGFDEQKFLSAVASGNPPDLVYMPRNFIGQYAKRRALVPLTSCIRSQRIPLASQYRQFAVREVTFQGTVYGIPEFNQSRTVIINRRARISAKLGLTAFNTANWNTIRATNRKLMRRSGNTINRIGFDPKLPEFFPLWAKANGVDILSANGRTSNISHPRAIAALQFAMSLINAHGGWNRFKAFRDTWDFFGARNQLIQNQIGAWPMEEFYFGTLARVSPAVRIDAVPFRARNGKTINYTTGSAWAIPRGADNQALACRWMKSMTAPATWVRAAQARLAARKAQGAPFLPVWTANKEADRRIVRQVYEPQGNRDFNRAVAMLLRVQGSGFIVPSSAAGQEVQTIWTEAVNRVLAGQQSPAAALRQADRAAQNALDRANR
jgi:multiple sugar transport system substrate-binding protein